MEQEQVALYRLPQDYVVKVRLLAQMRGVTPERVIQDGLDYVFHDLDTEQRDALDAAVSVLMSASSVVPPGINKVRTFTIFSLWNRPSARIHMWNVSGFSSSDEVLSYLAQHYPKGFEADTMRYWVGSHLGHRVPAGQLDVISWQELIWNGDHFELGSNEGPRIIEVTNEESAR